MNEAKRTSTFHEEIKQEKLFNLEDLLEKERGHGVETHQVLEDAKQAIH